MEEGYIGLDAAAAYLNVKPGTLRKWIRENPDIPAHQIGRLWKFKRVELDDWVQSGRSVMKHSDHGTDGDIIPPDSNC